MFVMIFVLFRKFQRNIFSLFAYIYQMKKIKTN